MKDGKLSKRAQRKAENAAANSGGSLTSGNAKYGLMGVAGVVVAGGLASFFSILADSLGNSTSIPFIDMYDNKVVQATFLSGEPNVVYCVSDKTEGGALPDLIGKIKAEVMKSKHAEGATFVAANCFRKSEVLDNKTVAEKFNFGKNEGFLSVFVNREKPLQLNYLADANQLAKQIVPLLKVEIKKAVYLKDFEVCQTGKSCVVLGGRTKMATKASNEYFKEYMRSHRGLKMVAVDTGFYDLKLGSSSFVEAQPRGEAMGSTESIDKDLLETDVVCIANVLQPKKSKSGRGEDEYKHFGKWLGSWEGDGVDNLLKECQTLSNTANSTPDKAAAAEEEILKLGFTQLSEKPAIKAKGSDAKPKVINAAENPMLKKAKKGKKREDVGLKQGGKESVGRRPDEKAEEDDDAIFPDEGEGEGAEGEEEEGNMFGDEAEEVVEEEA